MRNRAGDSKKEEGPNIGREVGRGKKQPPELVRMETEMWKAT